MSASITIGSRSLAANGLTLTCALAGGTGSGYTPSSGVTGLTVSTTTNGGSVFPIASATISGTTLMITLGAFIAAGETVTLDASGGSNLRDSASNTLVAVSGGSVTNTSNKTATRFDLTNSAIAVYGRLGSPGENRQLVLDDTEVVFAVTGTDATARVFTTTANGFAITVDGGAVFVPANTPLALTGAVIPLFSGLAEGRHVVVIKRLAVTDGYATSTNFIQASGAAPTISAVGAADGYGPYARTVISHPYADIGSWIVTGDSLYNRYPWADSQFRFSASSTSTSIVSAWCFGNGGTIALAVDGVFVESLAIPNDSRWKFRSFSAVDLSGGKTVSITGTGPDAVVVYFDAVMVSGTGAAFGSSIPAIEGIGGYGDSIVSALGDGNTRHGTLSKLAELYGYLPYNRGIGGTHVIGTGTAGQARTADITSIVPELPRCWVAYGVNDQLSLGGSPSGAFGTAFRAMLTALLAGTTGTMFFVEGIRLQQSSPASDTALWNGSGNGIQGSIAAVIAANPAYGSRLVYIDPLPMLLAGSAGTDFTTNYQDGLHLNDRGYTIEVKYFAPWFAPDSAYFVTGPSGGVSHVESAAFTVVLSGAGKFFTGAITISDGGAGGAFAPSVGSPATGSVTVTPTLGTTGFTFTYTPPIAGEKTLTFSNSVSGWEDPDPISYTAITSAATSIDVGGLTGHEAIIIDTERILDISAVRGASIDLTIGIYLDDAKTQIDSLVGRTVQMDIRDAYRGLIFSFSQSGNANTTGYLEITSAGKIRITNAILNIQKGSYVYDVFVKDSDNVRVRKLKGTLTVLEGATDLA